MWKNFSLVILLFSSAAHAQLVGRWVPVGPSPARNGQVENISNREVAGAINVLAAHPTNANVLYAGAVNGGVWVTQDANSAAPYWRQLTDNLGSLSIGALELDPTDAAAQTIVAGIGRTSSLGRTGGAQLGLFRSVDGGSTWVNLNPLSTFSAVNVVGLAPRGAVLVVATSGGLFRSTDTGASFSAISQGDGTATGLPAGAISDLQADPSNRNLLYLTLLTNPNGGTRGVYVSTNQGANWTLLNNAALNAAMAAASRAKISVGRSQNIYIAVVTGGRLSHVFRSPDAGANFSDIGVPITTENLSSQLGAHPGGQGNAHLSIAADPVDTEVVYIGGDRQPRFTETAAGGAAFPNSIGANDFSGRLFRAKSSATPVWTSLTHNGTPNNSSPHADSRDMLFDAGGVLIESDDGGVYRRTQALSASGLWLSMNGNLQVGEYHSMAYDSVSNLVIGGSQDTGTTEQTGPTRVFNSVHTGDGGDVAIEVLSDGNAIRYSSFQGFQQARRRTCAPAGTCTSTVFLPLTLLNASPAITTQFYTPIAANRAAAARLLIGGSNGLYESLNRGDTIDRVNTFTTNALVGTPLVYGAASNPELILQGSAATLLRRTEAAPGIFSSIFTAPANISDIAINPSDVNEIYLATASTVHRSTDGTAFTAITGNLATLNPGAIRALAYLPGAAPAIVIGAERGVFIAHVSNLSTWVKLGSGLPVAPVWEIDYDLNDQVLTASTLGRGIWRFQISDPAVMFRDGFEDEPLPSALAKDQTKSAQIDIASLEGDA
jgi:hypothetical protein